MAGNSPDRGRTVSTVLGRRLGGELLRLREGRSLRQSHAAEALTASVAKVAKIERGLVPIRDPDIRALCHLYGETDEVVVGRLLALAKADRERRKASGWWNQYPALQSMAEYVALEDIATGLRTWQLAIVPGLLQTPDYARALAVGNGSWEDPDEIEPFVESRMARQIRLTGDRPLELWALVQESVLRQLVGGRAVMRAARSPAGHGPTPECETPGDAVPGGCAPGHDQRLHHRVVRRTRRARRGPHGYHLDHPLVGERY